MGRTRPNDIGVVRFGLLQVLVELLLPRCKGGSRRGREGEISHGLAQMGVEIEIDRENEGKSRAGRGGEKLGSLSEWLYENGEDLSTKARCTRR